jgi:hypothetical protein
VKIQAAAELMSDTANPGCALALQHENSKNRTGRIACATKAIPQLAQESRFPAALGMTDVCDDLFCALEIERLEGSILRRNHQLAVKGAFRRTAIESFFRGKAREIGVVIFQRKMRKDEIARAGVKTFRIAKVFADGVIREMPGAAEDALLDDPRIRPNFQHVQIVIRFEQQTIGVAQMNFHKFGHVSKIGNNRHLGSICAKREADGVGRVMRNLERVDIDIANREVLAGLNSFHAAQTLREPVG